MAAGDKLLVAEARQTFGVDAHRSAEEVEEVRESQFVQNRSLLCCTGWVVAVAWDWQRVRWGRRDWRDVSWLV